MLLEETMYKTHGNTRNIEKVKKKTRKGENMRKRIKLLISKTGKCDQCGINLYENNRPAESVFPCGIEGCIYDV